MAPRMGGNPLSKMAHGSSLGSSVFRRGTPPARGSSRLSVEEGLVRSIAVDAVGHGRNVLHDQTVPRDAGIGRLCNQTLNQTSHAVIRGTSDATPLALRR